MLWATINIYNDNAFLAAMLTSIKDHVDGLIVVDGAYTSYLKHFREFVPKATAWSNDGTIEILNAFKDKPETRLYRTKDEATTWENQVVKRNFMINKVPNGDYFLGIDSDEMFMGDIQEYLEKFYESGCIAAQMPLYNPGLQDDRVVPRWHPRIFKKVEGMHYEGTHWHLRDKQGRIIEETYPMFWSDLAAIVHFKSFKDQSRLIPHQNYMLEIGEKGWIEPQAEKKKGDKEPWKKPEMKQ